jgi:hypothetical protein
MMTNNPRGPCPKCDGKRIFNGRDCTLCGGNGFIATLVDSDDDEPSILQEERGLLGLIIC